MNIPQTDHYAIITHGSYTVPGDERSRTNPGHGYPEHTVETIHYEFFPQTIKGREDWEGRIETLTLRRETFTAIIAQVPQISTTVSVTLPPHPGDAGRR